MLLINALIAQDICCIRKNEPIGFDPIDYALIHSAGDLEHSMESHSRFAQNNIVHEARMDADQVVTPAFELSI